jgi:hypothetical protein
MAADLVHSRLTEGVVLRPLRLLPIGKEAPFTEADSAFLDFALRSHIPVEYYQPCPKSKLSRERYLKYMLASTLTEALELGATKADLRFDYRRGYIKFPKHESILPGHVFHAQSLAERHGVSHVLKDVGLAVSRSPFVDASLANVYKAAAASSTSTTSTSWESDFNSMLETLYEPEPSVVEMLTIASLPSVSLSFNFARFFSVLALILIFPSRLNLLLSAKCNLMSARKLRVGARLCVTK